MTRSDFYITVDLLAFDPQFGSRLSEFLSKRSCVGVDVDAWLGAGHMHTHWYRLLASLQIQILVIEVSIHVFFSVAGVYGIVKYETAEFQLHLL